MLDASYAVWFAVLFSSVVHVDAVLDSISRFLIPIHMAEVLASKVRRCMRTEFKPVTRVTLI